MLGSYVSAAYQCSPTPEAARFFRGIIDWAGVSLPIEVTGTPLEVRHLERDGDVVLFAFNHDAASAPSVIRLQRRDGTATVTDLVTGAALTVTRDGDVLAIPVTIPAGEVRVLKVSPM